MEQCEQLYRISCVRTLMFKYPRATINRPMYKPTFHHLSILILIGVLVAGCRTDHSATVPASAEAHRENVFFNGTSFDGWDGVNEFFRVEDGAIVAGSMEKPIPQNEFLCTIREFSNFKLTLETRLVGEQTNAGIQFHTQRIPGDNEVIGYQADIGEGYWGGLYDESRRNRLMAAADDALINEILKVGDWNLYELEAVGPEVRIAINGQQTISYAEEDPEIPLQGRICVQIHSGPPGEVWYRSLELEVLD